MTKVPRFQWVKSGVQTGQLEPVGFLWGDKDGDLVRWSDYQKLEAKLGRSEGKAEGMPIDLDESKDPSILVHVGDVVVTEKGIEGEISGISVCLRPRQDPAGEKYSTRVASAELGVPFVVDLVGGTWAYGHQLRAIVRRWDEPSDGATCSVKAWGTAIGKNARAD